MTNSLVSLTEPECLALLATCDIGRIAVIAFEVPVIFPISYRVVQHEGQPAIAIRTRPDNVIDHVGAIVGFEVDSVDTGRDGAWSVLVRGVLRQVSPDDRLDPTPLVADRRDAWRVIVPTGISGRRLVADPLRWTFDPRGYL